MDARLDRLLPPRPGPSLPSPPRAHLPDGVRRSRAVDPAAQPRRGRPRQGSLLAKMPGDEWQRFANLRACSPGSGAPGRQRCCSWAASWPRSRSGPTTVSSTGGCCSTRRTWACAPLVGDLHPGSRRTPRAVGRRRRPRRQLLVARRTTAPVGVARSGDGSDGHPSRAPRRDSPPRPRGRGGGGQPGTRFRRPGTGWACVRGRPAGAARHRRPGATAAAATSWSPTAERCSPPMSTRPGRASRSAAPDPAPARRRRPVDRGCSATHLVAFPDLRIRPIG